MLTLPNYQIGSQIYESVNSLIYRGHRKKDNQPVILKMLKLDYPTPAELTRYRQEYEIMHDFDLAGVIKAYDIEKYQNTLVIILEDFGGESLKQVMAEQPLTLKAFLPIAILLSDSLGNIHAADIIHKDINPSNIVVNVDTKLLKIIDFGIASRLPRENSTLKNPEQLEGTLAYISPEQTGRINRSLDYRTDLYSLGVTFYELLTGTVPFESTDAMELVHCHIAKTPFPACEVNPDIPPIVSDIMMKLLAKNAVDRYQSAFGLKADLEKCLTLTKKVFGNKLFSTHFELAQNDFSGKFEIPQKLYGRKNEVNTLLQAFERVSQGTTEMMLVTGYSGVGKTTLVHEVHKLMTEKRGYFAAGKFDQFQKNIPYSAITQAFNEFCRYLLMENAETLANWQTQILEAVGNNGQIIIDVIPDLELIIGKQPRIEKVGPTEAQNRFNIFFVNFINVLCNKDHSFILFIDDLQWADSASLGLLKNIMLDDEIQHLLIIGAYRENEVDSTHPFMMVLSELEKANTTINTIELANLREGDINRLLQDSLSCEAGRVQPLSDLIYQKTQGNAFFTHQFLHTLYFEALLHFDFEQLKWRWNVEQIAAQNITDNVVELMANKINKLPSKTSKALQLAACMGNQFELSILAIIYEQDQNETLSVLHPAVVGGLIQPLDENYKHLEVGEKSQFKFLHDRVQQAAIALIDDEQKQAVHLQIGRLLLKHTPSESLQERIFDVVGHLNIGNTLITSPVEKNELARLNLIAGQNAKSAFAYNAALQYLIQGIALLPDSGWQSQYQLSLSLYEEATEVSFLSGQFERIDHFAEITLQHAKTALDTTKVYETRIAHYFSQLQMDKARNTGLEALNRLGIHFPDTPTPEDVQRGLEEIERLLTKKQMILDDLLHLPLMTEPLQQATMRLLSSTIAPCFVSSPMLLPLCVFKMVNLSIKHGNMSLSAFSYAYLGLVLVAFFNNLERGYQFGQLSLNVLAKLEAKEVKSKIVVIFELSIRPWMEPLSKTISPMREGYQNGLETGDIEWGTYCLSYEGWYRFLLGESLFQLEPVMESVNKTLLRLAQGGTITYYRPLQQTVLNLQGKVKQPSRLKGTVYDSEKAFSTLQQGNNRSAIFYSAFCELMLAYLFRDYEKAQASAKRAEEYQDGSPGSVHVAYFYFYDSLIQAALCADVSVEKQAKMLNKIANNQEKLKFVALHAPMNFQHKYDLVEAEKSKVLGQLEVFDLYEKAIAGARKNEYIQEEALAYELAAKFYLGRSMEKIAQTYMTEAHYRYQQWGALAKVRDLEERYPQFLVSKTTPAMNAEFTISATRMVSHSTKGASEWLDLNSIMKAAQTLSGEIVLSQLLEKMMHIVIENAGAETGFLLLNQQDNWFIEASGQVNSNEINVLQSLSIENQPIAQTIIQYVERTQEHVVLNHATQEGQFTRDPYIKKQHPKSVLCAPLINQGKLSGLLYLENNLTTGAFTPEHLEVLKVLSSQLAISIENALLYRTLEQKVLERTAQLAQRTDQLAQANEEITALNEQLQSENLRMSAELNVSRRLQKMLLPSEKELEAIDGLDIAGFMEPAAEVGGDYYDVLQHNGRILFGIGDVTGHGLESGALAIMVQSSIRTLLALNETDPVKFFSALNQMVFHNVQRMGAEKSLTLALVDYQQNQLYLSGQHEDIIVVRQGTVELIDTFDLGFPIGLEPDIADFVKATQVSLNAGDVVVLYTDGITEAENQSKEYYGLERLCQIVQHNWLRTAEEIQQAVIDDVRQFIAEQKVYDDITLLVLKQQ